MAMTFLVLANTGFEIDKIFLVMSKAGCTFNPQGQFPAQYVEIDDSSMFLVTTILGDPGVPRQVFKDFLTVDLNSS